MFAVPTYAFLVSMFVMIGLGVFRAVTGTLDRAPLPEGHIQVAQGQIGAVGIFLLLRAFASGGAAVTGVEAISNGVPAFKKPEWKNARSTLVVMASCLGVMFLGISYLAAKLHTVPSERSTVISQVATAVFGDGTAGHVAFYFVQAATMMILILAANTSFADFPRLASFHADDSFMPRQLTKRGHRLVFSNGIIALACSAAVLVVLFKADVTKLIPLYAIGVFTSFTLSQAGMAKRHLRLREPGWRLGLLINGSGAVATGIVTAVIAVTKFTHGAWFIMVLVPVLVAVLVRLNRQYEAEAAELEHEVAAAAQSPTLRRHSVIVLVEKLDLSTVRALQYARTLFATELRAVHIATDVNRAEALVEEWKRLGLSRISLEVVDCPDRRLERAVLDIVSEDLSPGTTEVSVLVPRREYRARWHRLLHDRTAERIAKAVARLPHANVTFVPYHFGSTSVPDEVMQARREAAHDTGH
jgi:hypothetical protein